MLGYKADAVFYAKSVSNIQINMSTDQSWSTTLLSESSWSSYDLLVDCWSQKCPHFFHFNPANFTFWINAEETYGYRVNGTYIYKVDLKNKSSGAIRRETITI